MRNACVLLLLPLLAGCPLYPDVYYDGGPDSGTPETDAGVDGGGVATGTINALLLVSPSNPNYQSLLWSGTDVAFSVQNVTAGTLTLRGDSLAAGHFLLQLGGLTPGSTSGTFDLAQYELIDGSESWSCVPASLGTTCSQAISILAYDGGMILGTFDLQFAQPTVGTDSASLTSGGFDVSFP
jgi:hypothetical protein